MGLAKASLSLDKTIAQEPRLDETLAALSADDVNSRRAAIRALALRSDAIDALVERLSRETVPELIEVLLSAIGKMGGPIAVKALIACLHGGDARRRNGAMEVLQNIGSDDVAKEIEALLSSPDSDLRILAVNVLHGCNIPTAPAILWKLIAAEPHVNVCAAAIEALAEIGRPEMVPALQAVTARFPDDPFIDFAARTAIKRIA